MDVNAILNIEHLSKTYRRRGRESVAALRDVNLVLKPGQIRFVYGPSGSGKSTLLLCAGGLLHPDAGNVKLDGRELYALPARARCAVRARRIGFVFQQFHLIPFLNVRDNVMAPALSGFDGDPRRRADALIERFGLQARRDHPPSELSVGERQRVALARALLFNPPLLLADEPTGNLDAGNGRRVMQYLSDFAGNGGAVLVVTHDRDLNPESSWLLDRGELHTDSAS